MLIARMLYYNMNCGKGTLGQFKILPLAKIYFDGTLETEDFKNYYIIHFTRRSDESSNSLRGC